MLDIIRIEIPTSQVRELKGTSQRTGKDYHIVTQDAYLHRGGRYPDKCEVPALRNSDKTHTPYPAGMYTITHEHVVVRDGRIMIDLYAAPLVAAQPVAAAPDASGAASVVPARKAG